MPPRYADFAKGRVLIGFNTSGENIDTPWQKDGTSDVTISSDYWDNPSASDELGKELKDTFHEVCVLLRNRHKKVQLDLRICVHETVLTVEWNE